MAEMVLQGKKVPLVQTEPLAPRVILARKESKVRLVQMELEARMVRLVQKALMERKVKQALMVIWEALAQLENKV